MYAYRNPDRLSSTHDWIQWVFRLRRKDRRHALEFVEGWNTTRIAVWGTVPWLASCLVGIIWAAMGGDPQTTFTVASFILTSSSSKSCYTTVLAYILCWADRLTLQSYWRCWRSSAASSPQAG